ncbi:MAG: AbrB/MazE/SpoVT family DNA-binding domain-containing protein [Deltaproteobacteria bacterium]|nr:AbrB/MazE/SpoVT family DNA-binding domain-containing protein [Deltaproteobacteria bacterium]
MKAVTVSQKGQVAIPKEIRERLRIKTGDQLIFKISKGKIILEPTINVPRSQAWFWTEEIQQKIKKAEKNFQAGNFKRYDRIDDLLGDLKE